MCSVFPPRCVLTTLSQTHLPRLYQSEHRVVTILPAHLLLFLFPTLFDHDILRVMYPFCPVYD